MSLWIVKTLYLRNSHIRVCNFEKFARSVGSGWSTARVGSLKVPILWNSHIRVCWIFFGNFTNSSHNFVKTLFDSWIWKLTYPGSCLELWKTHREKWKLTYPGYEKLCPSAISPSQNSHIRGFNLNGPEFTCTQQYCEIHMSGYETPHKDWRLLYHPISYLQHQPKALIE